MSKLIVTHINPDQDALSSVWLVRRYYPGFQGDDVEYAFVPAGETYRKLAVDADPDVVHVDTGLGLFDHHQITEKICAFTRIYDYLTKRSLIPVYDEVPLGRMGKVVNDYDNFLNVYYPDVTADYQEFTLDQITSGLIHTELHDKEKVAIILPIFDAILQTIKNKIKAEKNMKEGFVFQTKAFGKAIVMENSNNESMKFAQKSGFQLVARKDPKQGILCLRFMALSKDTKRLRNNTHRYCKHWRMTLVSTLQRQELPTFELWSQVVS
jgi:hypothetical protein